ncbi:toxin-antitoxin system YwqK family antitoxin [Chitinophaga sp. CF418]|uniref:toxin-antitoxin system YwqK family antitoxin n=1 Tax=Chitinophaga sp. CF418 TaxID=1855287 RepID=UPI000914EB19|nr:hypothetical protein [Chitinophaga sp. CF418]SHN38945.1 hypothetical protein SAMN05216311_11183 [Chitinophaga sp. CF418]
MRKVSVFLFLQFMMLAAFAQMPQVKPNKVDAQQRKQGEWQEEMPEVRGEPGYSWEGAYVDNLKEGVWKKYALSGGLIAEETYKHGQLNGYCRYFYSNGLVSAEGSFVAMGINGEIDNYRIVDPVTGEERFEEVKRDGSSQRNGMWKIYDEEGKMTKEYYRRGEPITEEEFGKEPAKPATTKPAPPPPPASLPHQKKKGKS